MTQDTDPGLKDDHLWPHPVRFDAALHGLVLDLTADEARREAIARAFGMISLESLRARIATRAVAGPKPVVHIDLTLNGEVTQECGVTLEPFSHAIEGGLSLDCIERSRLDSEVAEIGAREFSLEDLDEPDVIDNGRIDLGQYVIEALGEAYDPFARKPGAVFEEPEAAREPSPFAALAKLKREE